ncbi:hypothetical protein TorRG33x02_081310 [Trema orientale]|uniref:Uncharacterized protein n=1 Tax=Trema orientale TaxID=63057 RepID=A0A2P5FEH1_TREOI|nr:hypothetical protein TorRG33x02_081310 [Trema orientale]
MELPVYMSEQLELTAKTCVCVSFLGGGGGTYFKFGPNIFFLVLPAQARFRPKSGPPLVSLPHRILLLQPQTSPKPLNELGSFVSLCAWPPELEPEAGETVVGVAAKRVEAAAADLGYGDCDSPLFGPGKCRPL